MTFIDALTALPTTMDFSERPGWKVIGHRRIPLWVALLCLELDIRPRKDDTIKITTTQHGQRVLSAVPHGGLRIMQCPFGEHRHTDHHRICHKIHHVERYQDLYVFLNTAGTIDDDTGEMMHQLTITYHPCGGAGRLLLRKSAIPLDHQHHTSDYAVMLFKPSGRREPVPDKDMIHIDVDDELVFGEDAAAKIEGVAIDFHSIGGLVPFVVTFVADLIFWSPALLLWRAGFAPSNLELCSIYAIAVGLFAWERYSHWKGLVLALALRVCLFLLRF